MSLQVWLPLNEDLRNNGLCNCKTRNINAIYNSDEWCYNFPENGSGILLHNPPILDGALSFSFWLKYDFNNNSTSNTWHYIYSGRKANSKDIAILINNKKILFSNKCTFSYIFNTESSVWTNIIITYTGIGTTAKLYVNGELKNTIRNLSATNTNDVTIEYASIGSRSDNSDIISSGLRGSLRDFRIYDHCLSVKEIKELSKGLILHYPFNNNGLGYCNPNLLTGTADGTGWNKTGFDEEEKALYIINNTTSEKFIRLTKNNNIISVGKTYTLSADIKTNELVYSADMFVYDKNIKSVYNKMNIQFIDNKWYHHKFTFTVGENNQADWSQATIRFDNNKSKVEGQDAILYVKNIKLEEGSIDTPWIPNEADPEYIESLLDTSIVNDTSGFETYGIVNGDLSYDVDNPIYRSSIKSDADGNYIQGAKTLPNFDNMTLSIWVYPTKDNNYAIFSDRKSNLAIGVSADGSGFIVGTDNNYNVSYNKKNIPSTYNANNWHHIVLVKTASDTFNLYIDNVLTTNSSSTNAFTQNSDYFQIMHRLNNGDGNILKYYYQGKLSDLRIYATALSEDDIKELYESKISVDKDGNAYVKDIIEE